MRWFWRGCAVLAGTVLLAVGGLKALDRNMQANAARFYADRPMLNAMHVAALGDAPGGRPWRRMEEVLLRAVPVGSSRAEVQQRLRREKLDCSRFDAATRTLACVAAEKPFGVPTYHVDVHFDDAGRVVGGQVLALK